jgi:multiple sugar transport system substrate-binding protein
MQNTRRALLGRAAALAAAVVPVAAAACAVGSGAGEAGAPKTLKTGITLQWGSSGSGASRMALHQAQAQMFTEKQPGIKVEVLADGENLDKVQTGIAAGSPMDLISINEMRYAGFASNGSVLALDTLIKRDRYDLKDFLPRGLGAWQWRGKQYGLPFAGIMTPFVNLDLAQQAGGKQPPRTWSDKTWDRNAFLEFARRATKRDGDKTIQWGITAPHDNLRIFMSWVWAEGGDFFDKDLTRVTLSDPVALEGLQFHADLMNKHRVMPHPDELASLGGFYGPFTSNRAAIGIQSPGGIATNRQTSGLRWSLTALPTGSKGPAIGGVGSGWFMISSAKNQDETWELLKVIESPASDKAAALRGEALPARRSIATDPEFSNPKEAPGADMKVIVEALEQAQRVAQPLIQGQEIYNTIISTELRAAWSGQKSVREVVDIIKAKVEPMLAKERA